MFKRIDAVDTAVILTVALILLAVAGGTVLKANAKVADPEPEPARPKHGLDVLTVEQLDEHTQLIIAISDTGDVDLEIFKTGEVTINIPR